MKSGKWECQRKTKAEAYSKKWLRNSQGKNKDKKNQEAQHISARKNNKGHIIDYKQSLESHKQE